ncbi:MAG: von Willebrand factor type A domain-containing protein [Clostridia bacterium]|nr:von Willebrand factor type A domain-containing protein [Clostridia bacterium]
MKKTRIFSQLGALLLALLMVFSLASCAAGNLNEDYIGNDGIMGGPAGSQNNNSNNMTPEGDIADDNFADEEIGEDEDIDIDISVAPENPFINTSENNVSTFSADVDTASYAYFRKLVNSGYGLNALKGSGASFRIEEFINYFKYDVPQPEEGELFGVHTEIVPCPWSEETMLFRVTLQAEQAVNANGNNLVFLIDVSGSMQSSDKLPLLKRSFEYLVDNLGGDDVVSIVTYSGREAVVLEGCNGLDKERIMSAINSLTASGSTNGEAGLTKAYQIAETYFIEGGNNRIIMASDGDLNVGISSADQLTSYIEEKREQGVYLSVLGFGTGNYRDANMEAIADNGNGVYYYIDGDSEAEKVFGTDLFGTLYTVAEDVKLQIDFNADKVESYRLIGYENRLLANEDFENDQKDAGEVGASHQVTVCYEIKLREAQPDVEAPLMTLKVRYKNPGEPISIPNEYGIDESYISLELSDDMKFITSVIETCMILRSSKYVGDITLEEIMQTLSSLELEDPYKAEFYEILQTLVAK